MPAHIGVPPVRAGWPMTEILLTRHGDVPWLEPRRFRGRGELKLTDKGIAQAQATARRIGASWRPGAIYASPLGRTLQTARIIAEPLALPVQTLDALIDIDYGQWQGLTQGEAQARWPAEAGLWHRRPDLVRPPGGESLQDVLARDRGGAAPDHRPPPAGDGAAGRARQRQSRAPAACARAAARRATGRSARTRARSTGSRPRPRVFSCTR